MIYHTVYTVYREAHGRTPERVMLLYLCHRHFDESESEIEVRHRSIRPVAGCSTRQCGVYIHTRCTALHGEYATRRSQIVFYSSLCVQQSDIVFLP